MRSSGVDGVFVRPFVETDQDKLAYRDVPLPSSTTLSAAIRQAQFLGEKAFGVVPYAAGFGIRVKPEDFNETVLQIHPENPEQFIGKKLEISGLPMAMGKQSLLDFLGDWRVCPLHTFRHGFQRTWIVRSAQDPIEKLIPHDFGLAVINESVQRKSVTATERLQLPRKSDFPALS